MSTRSFIAGLLMSSVLGGLVALGVYKLTEKEAPQAAPSAIGQPVQFTNFLADSSFIVPEGLNFVYAAEVATPAVVHIRSAVSMASANQYKNPIEDAFKDFFGDNYAPDNGRNYGQAMSSGSGVIINPDGYIITNNHVIENATDIEVVLNDNRTFNAKVIGTDPNTDLALVKIDAAGLNYLTFGDSEKVRIGEWVLAVGNPFNLNSTVTAGIVSAKARNINILSGRNGLQIESFIQTDAAVNPGNSGGALVNLKGQLIGVNTAIATQTGSFSGYSFAVPVSLVEKVVNDLKEFGVVQRGLLGIRIQDVNPQLSKDLKLTERQGVYVTLVNPGSSAEEAGLKEGDVIIEVNDHSVNTVAQLQEQIALKRPGDKVAIVYSRKGSLKKTTTVLKGISGSTEFVKKESPMTIEGATFQKLDEEELAKFELENGVQIEKLNDGKWKSAGIKEGFIVIAIDKMEVKEVEDIMNILQTKRGGILIEGVYPDGEKAFYGVGW